MDDTVAPVRDAAAEALGTLLKLLGERAMAPFVDQLDKIKLDKVILKILCVVVNSNAHDNSAVKRVIKGRDNVSYKRIYYYYYYCTIIYKRKIFT